MSSSPQRKKQARRKRRNAMPPLLRLLAAAGVVIAIVLISAGVSTLLVPVSASQPQATPQVEETPTPVPTPTPIPTPTPTPAEFAPFGVQYGYGDASLIPETPQPSATQPPAVVTVTASPTPAATAYKAARTLKKGMNGEDVRRMQQALRDLGYLTDAADGAFGANTQEAVMRFQTVNGLTADGLAGQQTLARLYDGSALDASHEPTVDPLILVNRDQRLTRGYVPTELARIDQLLPESVVKVKYRGTRANRTAVEALGRMLQAAIAEGIGDWQISSAYRSYDDQQALVDQSVARYQKNNPSWSKNQCLSATYQTVAPAGTSEHQTGLAFDMTVPGTSFKGTKQQIWLHAHCAEYGFVVRFAEDKTQITGFLAEAWHIRYVGVDAARTMTRQNLCLEEYVQQMGR